MGYIVDREELLEEMERTRNAALKLIARAFNPKCIDDFVSNLAHAYFDELSSAIEIADELNLERIHFAALLEDENLFDELIDDHIDRQLMREAYDRLDD